MNKFLEFISLEFHLGGISICPLDGFYRIFLGEICNFDGFQSYLFETTYSHYNGEVRWYFDILYYKLFKRIINTLINCE